MSKNIFTTPRQSLIPLNQADLFIDSSKKANDFHTKLQRITKGKGLHPLIVEYNRICDGGDALDAFKDKYWKQDTPWRIHGEDEVLAICYKHFAEACEQAIDLLSRK